MSIVDLFSSPPGIAFGRTKPAPQLQSRHGRRGSSPRRHDWVEYRDILGSEMLAMEPPKFAEKILLYLGVDSPHGVSCTGRLERTRRRQVTGGTV